ncbi:unnamed protein product [Owenia fusiformis]|uniref:Uncharacterized protein n=1 Tax=Owenia fusiformis TaxID=6347 RepID=A0A8J1TZH9_OWEFU|nr:unnamed protein product [Owenia fusiformis]
MENKAYASETSIDIPKITNPNPREDASHVHINIPEKCPITLDKQNTPTVTDKETTHTGETEESLSKETCLQNVLKIQRKLSAYYHQQKHKLWKITKFILLIGWFVYIAFALLYNPEGAIVVTVITGLASLGIGYSLMKENGFLGKLQTHCFKPCFQCVTKNWRFLRWFAYGLALVGIATLLYFLVAKENPEYLRSLAGLVTIIVLTFITSTHPTKVNWRPVVWGLGLQFIFGLVVLRWESGYKLFEAMANTFRDFLRHSDTGSIFMFGEAYTNHPIAFQAFPQAIFFSSVMSVLFHVGIMKKVIGGVGWIMEVTCGTTTIESINAAANIIVSGVETAVIIRHWLPELTYSELHAVMTANFSTVSGVVFALFISLGAPPVHVVSAAIMSAPAALALSKLSCPETEESLTKRGDLKLDIPKASNILDAASNGAVITIKLISHVVVNIIAFSGLMTFVNAALSYIGGRVGLAELSFKFICGKVLSPLAYLLGVTWADAEKVGELIGIKLFVNEYLSYELMNRYYIEGVMTERSVAITTYTLTGFGSVMDIGIVVGVISAYAPNKKADLSKMAMRTLLLGNVAGWLTACVAGVLYQGQDSYYVPTSSAIFNSTTTISTM